MIALGTDFGPTLAPFWEPKPDQIGLKMAPKPIKKSDPESDWVWNRFLIFARRQKIEIATNQKELVHRVSAYLFGRCQGK